MPPNLLDETLEYLLKLKFYYAQQVQQDPSNKHYRTLLDDVKRDLEFVQGLKAEVDARTKTGNKE